MRDFLRFGGGLVWGAGAWVWIEVDRFLAVLVLEISGNLSISISQWEHSH